MGGVCIEEVPQTHDGPDRFVTALLTADKTKNSEKRVNRTSRKYEIDHLILRDDSLLSPLAYSCPQLSQFRLSSSPLLTQIAA